MYHSPAFHSVIYILSCYYCTLEMSHQNLHCAVLLKAEPRCQAHHTNHYKWALWWNSILKFNYKMGITDLKSPLLREKKIINWKRARKTCPSICFSGWKVSHLHIKVLSLAHEKTLILCLQRKDVSAAQSVPGYSLCGLALFVWIHSMWAQSFAVAVSL